MRPALALLLELAVLAACSSRMAGEPPAVIELLWDRSAEPPLVVNNPPDMIRARWTPSVNTVLDITDLVDQHCRAWNRHAEKVREQASGDTRTAEFVCKG